AAEGEERGDGSRDPSPRSIATRLLRTGERRAHRHEELAAALLADPSPAGRGVDDAYAHLQRGGAADDDLQLAVLLAAVDHLRGELDIAARARPEVTGVGRDGHRLHRHRRAAAHL